MQLCVLPSLFNTLAVQVSSEANYVICPLTEGAHINILAVNLVPFNRFMLPPIRFTVVFNILFPAAVGVFLTWKTDPRSG
jgi:hypothetical protein